MAVHRLQINLSRQRPGMLSRKHIFDPGAPKRVDVFFWNSDSFGPFSRAHPCAGRVVGGGRTQMAVDDPYKLGIKNPNTPFDAKFQPSTHAAEISHWCRAPAAYLNVFSRRNLLSTCRSGQDLLCYCLSHGLSQLISLLITAIFCGSPYCGICNGGRGILPWWRIDKEIYPFARRVAFLQAQAIQRVRVVSAKLALHHRAGPCERTLGDLMRV